MSDLISRQAVIDEIDEGAELIRRVLDNMDVVCGERSKFAWGLGLLESCIDAVNELPAAQPERKTGKWIDHSDDGYVECPFCRSATNCDDNINELHYCFSCGAKMEVEG